MDIFSIKNNEGKQARDATTNPNAKPKTHSLRTHVWKPIPSQCKDFLSKNCTVKTEATNTATSEMNLVFKSLKTNLNSVPVVIREIRKTNIPKIFVATFLLFQNSVTNF